MTNVPAGWYPDPSGEPQQRWWDGVQWTPATTAPTPPAAQTSPVQTAALVPPPVPTSAPARRRVPVWAWVVIGVAVFTVGLILSPVFAVISLIVLITGIVALAKNTPTWLRFRDRRAATWVTAVASVSFLITGSLASVVVPGAANSGDVVAAAAPTAAATEAPTETPTPHADPTPTAEPVDDETTTQPFDGQADTVSDATVTAEQTALEVLAALPVKGRAPKTGYDRDQFGQRWLDIDRNGCDTRNDILARDLTATTKSGPCKVLTGVLADPFTATTIDFVRGQDTSADVQIDHVVALSDAWQKGAQQLTADQRATFANDPLNLLAVDGAANAQKGDGDAATWLPKNKAFRCTYVARQVSVKATYGLWVTQAEHDAIERILLTCPDEPAATSAYAVQPAPEPESTPVEQTTTTPAPAKPAPSKPAPVEPAKPAPVEVYYANCTAVREAGVAPIYEGDPGYSYKLDRDKDGVACE